MLCRLIVNKGKGKGNVFVALPNILIRDRMHFDLEDVHCVPKRSGPLNKLL